MKSQKGFILSLFCFGFCSICYGSFVANFDSANPSATSTALGSLPGPEIVAGGPSGHFLRLVHNGVTANTNTYTFDATDSGLYPATYSVFEFRVASTSMPADGFFFYVNPN